MRDDKKLLFIMRHAKSDRTLADLIDFDRPLNDRGETEPQIIAKSLNQMDSTIDKAIVSSSRRTVDTWLLLEKTLAYPPDVIFDKRLYNAYFQDAIEVLIEEADNVNSLMMIGHNPSVEEICEYLSGEAHEFKPASCAILRAQDASLLASLSKRSRFTFERMIRAT